MVHVPNCCHGNERDAYHLVLSEIFASLIVLHEGGNTLYNKKHENVKNLAVFGRLTA